MKGLLSMDAPPQVAKKLAAMGQGEDSVLIHVQPDQVPKIARALGHPGTVNPRTGLLGFWERGGDGPGGGGGAGDGGGGESEGGGPGGGGFGGGWNRTSTSLSADDMAARGLNGYAFGGDGRSTQDFAPNSWGLGFLGLTPGTVASPEGLLAGTYARDWALGWSPTALGMGALSAVTRLPIGMIASLAGFRPDDYSVVGSLGGMSAPGGLSADAGAGGPGGGLGGHGGADQFAYGSTFGGNAPQPTPAAAHPGFSGAPIPSLHRRPLRLRPGRGTPVLHEQQPVVLPPHGSRAGSGGCGHAGAIVSAAACASRHAGPGRRGQWLVSNDPSARAARAKRRPSPGPPVARCASRRTVRSSGAAAREGIDLTAGQRNTVPSIELLPSRELHSSAFGFDAQGNRIE